MLTLLPYRVDSQTENQRRELVKCFGDPSSPDFSLRWKCSVCGGRKGPKIRDPLGQRYCCGALSIAYEARKPGGGGSKH